MKDILLKRTKDIGIAIIGLVENLPVKQSSRIITSQIIRCSTSIGANYRAACRAKSNADFINKLKIVEEETDETLYWLEILEETKLLKKEQVEPIMKETKEILAIITASLKTLRNKKDAQQYLEDTIPPSPQQLPQNCKS